jgi:hypothetical protein
MLLPPNAVYTSDRAVAQCPGLSSQDRALVQMRMRSGELFPTAKGDDIRLQIFDRLCSIKNSIISMYTFIQNTKCLEPWARILKQLLPSTKYKGSLSQHFQALHSGQSTIKVQTSEFEFQERKLPEKLTRKASVTRPS